MVEHAEQRLLLEGLRRIPLDYQVALELYHWEGMTGPELAEALDIPEATVRSRLRRGVERLRERMQEIAESGEQLKSTLANLDNWAESLRDRVSPAAS
jgi:RNA polymerase sigma-70 factor (ECF subfamily)